MTLEDRKDRMRLAIDLRDRQGLKWDAVATQLGIKRERARQIYNLGKHKQSKGWL